MGRDEKPKFQDLIRAGERVKSEVLVDLTGSPPERPSVKRSKSLFDSYGSQSQVAEVKPGDFLSRLGSASKAIDFNDTSSLKSQVKGEEAGSSQTQQQPRKRKYKLVDNEQPRQPVVSSSETLPEDKAELIKVVKSKLSKEDYKGLLNALKDYQAKSRVAVLYEEMSRVFVEHPFMLRGMQRFVRESDQKEFEKLLLASKNNNAQ